MNVLILDKRAIRPKLVRRPPLLRDFDVTTRLIRAAGFVAYDTGLGQYIVLKDTSETLSQFVTLGQIVAWLADQEGTDV